MNTEELEARQAAALAANAARIQLVKDLQASNARQAERIKELEAAGTDVTALKAELEKSNGLLQQLQDAVIDAPVLEPAPDETQPA
jgi:hypothetical protein